MIKLNWYKWAVVVLLSCLTGGVILYIAMVFLPYIYNVCEHSLFRNDTGSRTTNY